jgi:hypothetical protein
VKNYTSILKSHLFLIYICSSGCYSLHQPPRCSPRGGCTTSAGCHSALSVHSPCCFRRPQRAALTPRSLPWPLRRLRATASSAAAGCSTRAGCATSACRHVTLPARMQHHLCRPPRAAPLAQAAPLCWLQCAAPRNAAAPARLRAAPGVRDSFSCCWFEGYFGVD